MTRQSIVSPRPRFYEYSLCCRTLFAELVAATLECFDLAGGSELNESPPLMIHNVLKGSHLKKDSDHYSLTALCGTTRVLGHILICSASLSPYLAVFIFFRSLSLTLVSVYLADTFCLEKRAALSLSFSFSLSHTAH